MSKRQIELVILCEDKQQQVFIRQFLTARGIPPQKMRFRAVPHGKQAGEQYVRQTFAQEVKTHRAEVTYRASIRLVAMLDADIYSIQQRLQHLDTELENVGQVKRQSDEKIAVFIPKRNIETWIHYLMGTEVDETTAYAKFNHESDCKPYIENLAQNICPVGLPLNAPPSLHHACDELKRIL